MTTPALSDPHAESRANPDPTSAQPAAPVAAKPRLWFPISALTVYWAFTLVAPTVEMHYFFRWVSGMAAGALVDLSLAVWWLRNRRIDRGDRWFGAAVALAGGIAAVFLCDKSFGAISLALFSLPVVLTTASLSLMLASRVSIPRPRAGLALVILATWGYFGLLRMDGLTGELKSEVHWRWTLTAEDQFLAEARRENASPASHAPSDSTSQSAVLTAGPADWPGFRGPQRDGVVRGVSIATDWTAAPPRQVWKRRVGPAWSSMTVIGERLFTQEQRGEMEAVVCLAAATGSEIWVHEDRARFWEAVAGAGPRATPTFDDGYIYSQGATGILNCLDAISGKLIWSRDIAKESAAKVPIWGFSSSPLVVEDVVIAYAGGENDKGLLGYRADSGEPLWSVATGHGSYSSPHLVTFGGKPQVLFLSDGGLVAVEPATGNVLWTFGGPSPGAPVSLQPLPLDESRLLIQSAADFGMALIDITCHEDSCTATKNWGSSQIKPSFNDFVVYQNCAYGFDGSIFACFDVTKPRRRWKQGRYGYGQVMLLADQGLLLVVTETGEVVLLAATPEKHEELARFQAVAGKTWNHPALAAGRLYVRNAEEMACFVVGKAGSLVETTTAE